MDSTAERSDGFAMAVVVEGGLALGRPRFGLAVSRFAARAIRRRSARRSLVAVVRGLARHLPMLVVFWLLVNSKWPMLRQLREQVEWLIDEMFPTASIAAIRDGRDLGRCRRRTAVSRRAANEAGEWTTPIIGLLLTSFLFGLAHALSKLYFVFAIAVGAFLGWLALEYHDLVAPMVAHGLYDFVALVYLSKNAMRREQSHDAVHTIQHPHEVSAPHHDESADR